MQTRKSPETYLTLSGHLGGLIHTDLKWKSPVKSPKLFKCPAIKDYNSCKVPVLLIFLYFCFYFSHSCTTINTDCTWQHKVRLIIVLLTKNESQWRFGCLGNLGICMATQRLGDKLTGFYQLVNIYTLKMRLKHIHVYKYHSTWLHTCIENIIIKNQNLCVSIETVF